MSVLLDFICSKDNCSVIQHDVLCANGEPVGEHPRHCGVPMVWVPLPNRAQAIHNFVAFDTRNIHPDGKSIHIGSKGDLEWAAREYGVRHFDDPDLVAEGNQIVRKTGRIGKVFDMGGRR